jgi:hypothetical protein
MASERRIAEGWFEVTCERWTRRRAGSVWSGMWRVSGRKITENWLLPVRNVIPDEDGNVIEPVSDEEMGNICGD